MKKVAIVCGICMFWIAAYGSSLIGDAKDLKLEFKGDRVEISKEMYSTLDIIECSCKANPTKVKGYILFDFVGRQKNSGTLPTGGEKITVTFYAGNKKLGKDLIIDSHAPTEPGGTRVFGGTAMVKGQPTKAVLAIMIK